MFIAQDEDVSTVVCAPTYSEILGLSTEVSVGPAEGLPHNSSVRCDFLTLMLKGRLSGYVSALTGRKLVELDRALATAVDLDI